jgi:hypothetical protein
MMLFVDVRRVREKFKIKVLVSAPFAVVIITYERVYMRITRARDEIINEEALLFKLGNM